MRKKETVLFEDEGSKKIMLQLLLIFCMSIIHRLDINCAVTCGCSTQTTMIFSHPKRTSAWCCRVPSGILVLLGINFNMPAQTRSLTTSFFLLSPPCMLSTLFQTHSMPAVLLLFVNCVMPSLSLLPCITKRKTSLPVDDCLCQCNYFTAV